MFAILVAAAIVAVGHGCKCSQDAFCVKTQRSDYLFHGIVRQAVASSQDISYHVEIQKVFKFAPGIQQQSELTIRSSFLSASCGLKLAVNDEYLFATDSQLWITSCSATMPWSSIGKQELAVLQAGGVCGDCAALSCGKQQTCAREAGVPYCTDICQIGRCALGESCSLIPATNCNNGPCPNVAVCNPTPVKTTCVRNCTAEFNPVCGSDGVTYSNECQLKNAACRRPELQVAKAGECCTRSCCKFRQCRAYTKGEYCTDTCHAERCPKGYHCKLYPAKQCSADFCPEVAVCEPACKQDCPKTYLPICGSNGVTYANVCELHKAQCSDSSLALLHHGICSSSDAICDKLTHCPDTYEPLCGSDGVTYPNACAFELGRCGNPALTISHEGSCGVSCDFSCPAIDSPVCSNQGITYANECLLKQAACKRGNIWLKKSGACDKCS